MLALVQGNYQAISWEISIVVGQPILKLSNYIEGKTVRTGKVYYT